MPCDTRDCRIEVQTKGLPIISVVSVANDGKRIYCIFFTFEFNRRDSRFLLECRLKFFPFLRCERIHNPSLHVELEYFFEPLTRLRTFSHFWFAHHSTLSVI